MNQIRQKRLIEYADKHGQTLTCNYFVFKGVGCGFVINGKRRMIAQKFDLIMFIILR